MRYRHKKRGTTLETVGKAQVQCSDDTPLTDYEVVKASIRDVWKSGELWVAPCFRI